LEDQIAIVAVATCHEKDRRGRRELLSEPDLTRDFSLSLRTSGHMTVKE